MSQVRTRVGSAVNGSRKAVDGSGNSTMSDWWMPRQPLIEEPSNILPSSNSAASTMDFGNVTWCCTPRMSAKRRSTNSTLWSLISFSMVSKEDMAAGLREFEAGNGGMRGMGNGGFRRSGTQGACQIGLNGKRLFLLGGSFRRSH